MLPQPNRLRRRVDFSRAVRRGRRVARRAVVVHALLLEQCERRVGDDNAGGTTESEFGGGSNRGGVSVRFGGVRVGLIVSKAVGDAVVRHRVARRLRHVCARVFLESDTAGEVDRARASILADVVVRALPGAAHATSGELEHQLRWIIKTLSAGREECTAESEARPHAAQRGR